MGGGGGEVNNEVSMGQPLSLVVVEMVICIQTGGT